MAKRIKKQIEVVETLAPVVELDAAGNVISHAAPLPVVTLDDVPSKMRAQARLIQAANAGGGYAAATTFVIDVEMPLDYQYNRGKAQEFLHLEDRLLAVKVGGYSGWGDGAQVQAEFGIVTKMVVGEKWATPDQGAGSKYWEFDSEATLNCKAVIFEGRVTLLVKELNTHSGGWRRASAEGIRFFAKSVECGAIIAEQLPAVLSNYADAR